MLVAFLGTHAPLLVLVFYLLLGSSLGLGPALRILALMVVVTLVDTAATLLALRGLLAPISLTSSALKGYIVDRQVPDLPTGLLNRRQGEKFLAEEAARVRRSAETLTLGVVDINSFKHINDTYGHQAGDTCIHHVADVIRRNIRQGDWLARWGGDEFILVLREANPFAQTEAVLQRIVRDLKDSPLRLPQGEELVLTVTVGASRYSSEEDLRELLAKADEAMYEAKREGRPWILST